MEIVHQSIITFTNLVESHFERKKSDADLLFSAMVIVLILPCYSEHGLNLKCKKESL